MKGCHIVPKSSPGSNATNEWRFSFSQAEVLLANARTKFQSKCYLVAKSIFYVYIKKYNAKVDEELPSYVLKTIMFQMLEEIHPDIWKWEAIKDVFAVVKEIFARLYSCLKERHLKSLFSNDIDLLKRYSSEFLQKIMTPVFNVSKEPWLYLPRQMNRVYDLEKEFIRHCSFERYLLSSRDGAALLKCMDRFSGQNDFKEKLYVSLKEQKMMFEQRGIPCPRIDEFLSSHEELMRANKDEAKALLTRH